MTGSGALPPLLLRKAERVAQEENRTKSELLREALRLYIDTRDVRKAAAREQLFGLIDRVQARTGGVSPGEIRNAVRDAIKAVLGERRRSTA